MRLLLLFLLAFSTRHVLSQYGDPNIMLNPGDSGPMIVRNGEQVYSRCTVDDPNAYTIHWIRRLPDGSDQELSSNSILILDRVSTADIQYPIYCEAIRVSDEARFDKKLNIQFGVTLPPELQLMIESLPTEDLATGKVMRSCRFVNEPEINQLFDFRWLDQNGRVYTNGNTLYLTQIDNLADLGNYTCEAVHQQTAAVYQANFRVSREVGSTASSERPPEHRDVSSYRVTIRHNIQDAAIGEPYEMECLVTPTPPEPITYRWLYNNRLIGQDSILRIPALSPNDLQEFVCKAEWASSARGYSGPTVSEMRSNVRMRLTRDRMIDMAKPPGALMVTNPGESRELHCEFTRLNPRDVQWFFNDQAMERVSVLNSTGQFFMIPRMRVSIISIQNVRSFHAGKYECRVDGEVKQVNLVVQGEQGLEVNPSEETVNEGEAVEFHCRASSGEPNVNRQLIWFYQGLNSPDIVPLRFDYADGFNREDDQTTDHTSFINKLNVRVSDEGYYICRLPSLNIESKALLRINAYRPPPREIYITPSVVRVRAHQEINMECYTVNEQQMLPQFRMRDTSVQYETSQISSNRIGFRIIHGLSASYNGTVVECALQDGVTYTTAVIIIEDVCPAGHRRCRSGQCLPAGRFCDNIYDCDDRSDEDPAFCTVCDPIAKKCEVNQGRPPIKDVYMIHWVCDGEDDCGNGWDEANCPSTLFASCVNRQFSCSRSQLYIPLAFVCDKDQDCPYGEDEQNCGSPVIEHTSNYRYNANRGGTVRLECTVRGHPLPRVIWRFNWGCIPENSRFRVTHNPQNCGSQMPSVVSVLTISNFQPGDDGIYNCEALSGSVRAMSNDYFVMMNN